MDACVQQEDKLKQGVKIIILAGLLFCYLGARQNLM